jgi:hypothetical protein
MRYQADTATHRKPTTLRMTRGQFSGRPDKQRVHRTTLRTKRTHQVSARQKDKPADDKNEDRSRFNVFQLGLEARGRRAPKEQLALGARHSSGWKHATARVGSTRQMGAQGAARIGSTPRLGLEARHGSGWKHKGDGRPRSSSHWEHATARFGSTRQRGAEGAARIGSTSQLGLEAQGRWAPKEQLALGARHRKRAHQVSARQKDKPAEDKDEDRSRLNVFSSGWEHKADGRPRSSSHWEHATASAPTK